MEKTKIIITFVMLIVGCRFPPPSSINLTDENHVKIDSKLQLLIKCLEKENTGPFDSYIKKDNKGNVVKICLSSDFVSKNNLKILLSLSQVNELILCCCANNPTPLTPDTFNILSGFKRLKHLELYGAVDELSINMCNSIASIKSLESLTIEYSIIPKEGILILKRMNLRELKVSKTCTVQ